jgi:hypothetical protein
MVDPPERPRAMPIAGPFGHLRLRHHPNNIIIVDDKVDFFLETFATTE